MRDGFPLGGTYRDRERDRLLDGRNQIGLEVPRCINLVQLWGFSWENSIGMEGMVLTSGYFSN